MCAAPVPSSTARRQGWWQGTQSRPGWGRPASALPAAAEDSKQVDMRARSMNLIGRAEQEVGFWLANTTLQIQNLLCLRQPLQHAGRRCEDF